MESFRGSPWRVCIIFSGDSSNQRFVFPVYVSLAFSVGWDGGGKC